MSLLADIGGPVRLGIGDALGCVLLEPARAATRLPVFDNSQMDGFAVRAADVAAGVALPVAARIYAGSPATPLAPGTAAAIMTGAPIPPGADAVIPVEESDEQPAADGTVVTFTTVPQAGAFIRRAGSDAQAGELIVEPGTALAPHHLGALAAAGVTDVVVYRRPRVAVISTGSELVAPGLPLAPGQIHESNSVALAALVSANGAAVISTAVAGDGDGEFAARLDEAVAAGADLVLTSGGVSAGEREPVRDLLSGPHSAATESWFGAVAMQPGGPQGLSRWRAVPVISLPGNPVSVLVSFDVLVRDAVRAIAGLAPIPVERGHLTTGVASSPPGKTQYLRARRCDGADGGVEIIGGPSSHLIATAARADVLVEIDAATTELAPDTEVPLWPLTH
jgi:molybdopterin molybdotransferase